MTTRFPAGSAPVNGASSNPVNGVSAKPIIGASAVPTAIARERRYAARNYDPLPVVLAHGDGCWLWDEHGRRYLDMMSAYSAVSHGHAHPRIVRALVEQAQRLAVTSRVFHNELLPALLKRLAEVTGLDRALPANGGAEAVETALKAARKWGHKIKGIPADSAEIIVCAGNFHGRSITIVGFSSEPQYRDGFGPFAPGFRQIPYGDADALARAIGPNTAAFLVEPIQGEGGIIVPPAGYLAECARICRDNNVLMICDEIQTGMGRTGKFLASEHENVHPDGVILGKALGGGLLPVSALVGTDNLMQVFSPGDHGSTFGGNPLASAVALTALDVLFEEGLIARSAEQGAHLLSRLRTVASPLIREVRGKGLFIGVEVDRDRITARDVVDRLLARGILSKDTHGTVVRFAPPLTIERETLDWAVEEVRAVFVELGGGLRRAA
jgi:ornithine--oxo-acid transaminase